MQAEDYCIVIPIYNGQKHLLHLIDILKEKKHLRKYNFFIVDDNSNEDYSEILKQLKELTPALLYHKNQKTLGLHPSIASGFNKLSIDIMVTLDQDFIPILPELVVELSELNISERQLTYIKVEKKERTWVRSFASKLTRGLIQWFGDIHLDGLYAVRVVKKDFNLNIPLTNYLIFDLHLLKNGYYAQYTKSNIAIKDDKKGNTTFFALSIILLNITLFYTFFFESITLVLGILYILFHNSVFLGLIIILALTIACKSLNLIRK